MKKVFEQWPAPIVQNPFELGPRLRYPASVIESGFTWTDHHPVVDAYKDYRKMPYDRQTWDLLSVVYLLHPELFRKVLKAISWWMVQDSLIFLKRLMEMRFGLQPVMLSVSNYWISLSLRLPKDLKNKQICRKCSIKVFCS